MKSSTELSDVGGHFWTLYTDYSCIIYIFLKIGIHDEHYLSTDEFFTRESEFCNLETKVKPGL